MLLICTANVVLLILFQYLSEGSKVTDQLKNSLSALDKVCILRDHTPRHTQKLRVILIIHSSRGL